MDAKLPKEQRLKADKDINSLLKEGVSLYTPLLKVMYRSGNGLEYNRIMISAPKRLFKRAVKRNLIKRRIREQYRLNKGLLPAGKDGGCDIFFIYRIKETASSERIHGEITAILEKIAVKNADRNDTVL